jgi:hypothetical protein
MHGARVVFSSRKRDIGARRSPTKVGCVARKLRDVRLHAEPRRSRLVVNQGTRDSIAATARSPASRRHKVPQDRALPWFLDHRAGRMWTFVLDAGSSPAVMLACATTGSAMPSVVTTKAGRRCRLSSAVGRIPSPTMPSTLEVALEALGRRSSKPRLGLSEAI